MIRRIFIYYSEANHWSLALLDNFKEVNFNKQVHEQYADNKYKPGLFQEYVKRLLKNFINKTGVSLQA